ncbi:MAG TPA: class I SAM-dependent methyltransferase [Allosphingosinicella sp.]|nr:class I SAM-dependent methyltransferase [Allosphingosinicella sp.]
MLNEESWPNNFDGLFVSEDGSCAYAIETGVPIMLPAAIPPSFAALYQKKIQELGVDISKQIAPAPIRWSFSDQWRAFSERDVERTWGLSTESRVEMFFAETQLEKMDLSEKVVLDAGCGNGLLTEALGSYAKLVIGMDYSDSVFEDAKRSKVPNVLFIRGDVQNPPFKRETLDIIVSNGVLHHTPSTVDAFKALASRVADGGSFYVWLYRFSDYGNIFRRTLRRTVMAMRAIVSPLPRLLRTPIVHAFAGSLVVWTRLTQPGKRYDYSELFINAHDSLTPRYRTMHTPTEVAEWYFECGFGPLTLTHWDNRTGFGVVARKIPQDWTSGVNFGAAPGTVQRFGL